MGSLPARSPSWRSLAAALLVLFWTNGKFCQAMIPTAQLNVEVTRNGATEQQRWLLASQASFGTAPPMRGTRLATPLQLQTPPPDNADLCKEPTATATPSSTALLVPRGTCTFETKAYHAQLLGAQAVIVHGSLSRSYALNSTATTAPTEKDIVWPTNLDDYDCDKGRAWIPKDSGLSFDPLPYNAAQNDPLLGGPDSLCRQLSPDRLAQCPSQACLLTGNQNQKTGAWEACCAWDLHIWLYADDAFHNASAPDQSRVVTIPAAYVTWHEGQELLHALQQSGTVVVTVQLYERWRPQYNVSSALIWILAVIVAALASYLSASDYHAKRRKVLQQQNNNQAGGNVEETSPQQQQRQPAHAQQPEETLELNAWHALGFLVMASTSLLVLFYFKIYGLVKVMYAFGCSKALSTILLAPVVQRVLGAPTAQRVLCHVAVEDIGDVTVRDLVAHVIGYALGAVWLYQAFTNYHPETIPFFWIMQDVFGACMCILFLQVVKLNSIRVASILLVVAFFYDIFFVFISPLIFSKSVMLDVATSGGPPPNPEWCEKYPDDPVNCQQRGNPMPMLFTIPRIDDYQGGANLLGLGDVVVPGLLLSFAARFDAAKSLLGVMGGGNGSLSSYACPEQKYCGSTCWNGGYFVPVVIAYGIGLLMANAAVYYMEMGQPALLYLVPCCLGMVLFIGWKRKELPDLWDGPKALRAADVILYGEDAADHDAHAPIPQGDDDDENQLEAPAVPSALDQ